MACVAACVNDYLANNDLAVCVDCDRVFDDPSDVLHTADGDTVCEGCWRGEPLDAMTHSDDAYEAARDEEVA